jgi:hypothetical protein
MHESGGEKDPTWRGNTKDHHHSLQRWGQAREGEQAWAPILCTTDGPTPRHGRSGTPPD